MGYRFYGRAISGQAQLDNPSSYSMFLESLEGKYIYVDVGTIKNTRSNQQNRYLWGVCYAIISEHTGHTPEELHEYCKMKFLSRKFRLTPQGEETEMNKTTTELSTDEFTAFVEQVRGLGAELGCIIPDPQL